MAFRSKILLTRCCSRRRVGGQLQIIPFSRYLFLCLLIKGLDPAGLSRDVPIDHRLWFSCLKERIQAALLFHIAHQITGCINMFATHARYRTYPTYLSSTINSSCLLDLSDNYSIMSPASITCIWKSHMNLSTIEIGSKMTYWRLLKMFC